MRNTILIAAYVCVLLAFESACTGEEKGETTVPVDTMSIVDSIGVLSGDDNYTIGMISDIDRGVNGEIIVLDWSRSCIREYSMDGEYVRRIGRYGEGPGEFNDLKGLCACGTKGAVVINNTEWYQYDSEWNFVSAEIMDNSNISSMQAGNDSLIIGIKNYLQLTGSGMHIERRLESWNRENPDEIINEYFKVKYVVNCPEDLYEEEQNFQILYTVTDESIFAAKDSQNEPKVYVYNLQGDLLDEIEMPYEQVRKTEREIAQEAAYIQGYIFNMTSGEKMIEYIPNQYKPMIRSIGCDAEGNVWVQRGFEDIPFYDVIDNETHEVIKNVIIEGIDNTINWNIYATEYGVVAAQVYDYDYPKVYILK